jgi:hypothetical protein
MYFGVQCASPHAPQTGCAQHNFGFCPVDGSERNQEIRPGASTSLSQSKSKSLSTSLGEAHCTRG